jgi:hypothetical protein
MSSVVGNKAWTKQKHKETLSDIATCSDETFLLLTLENNYDRWMSEASWRVANEDKELADHAPKMFPNSKYTNSGKSQKNGQSKRLQGWSRDGYVRFNKLYKRVQNDRLRQANFETELLAVWRNNESPTTQNTRDVAMEEELIFPANDLTGLIAPTRYLTRNEDMEEEQTSSAESDEEEEDPYKHKKA